MVYMSLYTLISSTTCLACVKRLKEPEWKGEIISKDEEERLIQASYKYFQIKR